jgi:hypothetical protein
MQENRLILTIDFETPPSAAELGDVFVALARDYRDLTRGRVLVVMRVESGSIIATLTDAALAAVPYIASAAAVIAGINQLSKFAENIQTWLGYAKSHEEKKPLYQKGKKAPGQRSVEAIIKLAASTRSHVRVKHTTAEGETLEAELTPDEAVNVVEAVDAAKAGEQQAQAEAFGAARDERNKLIMLDAPEVRGAIERLQQMGDANLSPSAIHALVDVVVAVLEAAGAGHLLPEIAFELERRGLFKFADAVRHHIRPSGGMREPPLTTT